MGDGVFPPQQPSLPSMDAATGRTQRNGCAGRKQGEVMEMRTKIGAWGTDVMARGAAKARAASRIALAASLLFAASPALAGGFTAADIQFLYGKDDGDFGGTGPSGNE